MIAWLSARTHDKMYKLGDGVGSGGVTTSFRLHRDNIHDRKRVGKIHGSLTGRHWVGLTQEETTFTTTAESSWKQLIPVAVWWARNLGGRELLSGAVAITVTVSNATLSNADGSGVGGNLKKLNHVT